MNRISKLKAAVLILLSFTCLSVNTAAKLQKKKIKVGTFKLVHMMIPLFYEKFLPSNVEVELVYFTSSLDVEKALMNGSISFGEYGTTAAIIAASQGDPQVIVADAARKGVAIVVNKNSSINSIEDLKKKRIATNPGSLQDVLLRTKLIQAKIDPVKDVNLIKVSWADMPSALQRGEIDAFAGTEPHPTRALEDGYGRILSYPYDTPIGNLNSALMTTKLLVEKDPQLVQAIVCAQKGAFDFMQSHQAEWIGIGEKTFGFDPKITKASMVNVGIGWELSDDWIKDYKQMGKALLDLKIVEKEPDYGGMINQSFSQFAKAGNCSKVKTVSKR